MCCYHRQESQVDFRGAPRHSPDKGIRMGKLLCAESHWSSRTGNWTYKEVIVRAMPTIAPTRSLTFDFEQCRCCPPHRHLLLPSSVRQYCCICALRYAPSRLRIFNNILIDHLWTDSPSVECRDHLYSATAIQCAFSIEILRVAHNCSFLHFRSCVHHCSCFRWCYLPWRTPWYPSEGYQIF